MDQNALLSRFDYLESRLKSLAKEYRQIKEELSISNDQNEELKRVIHRQQDEIKNFQNQLKISKIVKSIAEGTSDSSGLKLKINEYIKEIDKCIAHLSE